MYWQSEKKLIRQQYLLHMSVQYGELRPINGWDLLAGLGHPSKFQRLSRLGSNNAAKTWKTLVVASAKLCGVEKRAPPIFSRAAITLALAHIASYLWNVVPRMGTWIPNYYPGTQLMLLSPIPTAKVREFGVVWKLVTLYCLWCFC